MIDTGARTVSTTGDVTVPMLRFFVAGVAMLALSGRASANLLTNGNFAAGDLTGWAASGDVMAIPEVAYSGCCGTLDAAPGAYVASFGAGNVADNGVLAQAFPTVVGLGYVVSFDYGAVDFSLPQSLDMSLVSGATTLGASLSTTGSNDFDTLFTLYSYSFIAEATTTTLTFTDTSGVTDNVDGLLAQVSADIAPTGEVPEPSSSALLGVGLMGVGIRRMVRRPALARAVAQWRRLGIGWWTRCALAGRCARAVGTDVALARMAAARPGRGAYGLFNLRKQLVNGAFG